MKYPWSWKILEKYKKFFATYFKFLFFFTKKLLVTYLYIFSKFYSRLLLVKKDTLFTMHFSIPSKICQKNSLFIYVHIIIFLQYLFHTNIFLLSSSLFLKEFVTYFIIKIIYVLNVLYTITFSGTNYPAIIVVVVICTCLPYRVKVTILAHFYCFQ